MQIAQTCKPVLPRASFSLPSDHTLFRGHIQVYEVWCLVNLIPPLSPPPPPPSLHPSFMGREKAARFAVLNSELKEENFFVLYSAADGQARLVLISSSVKTNHEKENSKRSKMKCDGGRRKKKRWLWWKQSRWSQSWINLVAPEVWHPVYTQIYSIWSTCWNIRSTKLDNITRSLFSCHLSREW